MLGNLINNRDEQEYGTPSENVMDNDAERVMGSPTVQEETPTTPQKQVSFDVERNPQDMQFMTDSMAYAPMLKAMDEDQRKEKWPGMVEKLGQVSPKAQAMLDPSLPPSDADLDNIIGKMPKAGEAAEKEMDVTGDAMGFAHQVPSDLDTENMTDGEVIANATNVGMFDEEETTDPRFKGAPKGYMWVDPKDKTKGLQDLRKKEKSTEAAGKIMMMETAKALMPTIKSTLFTPEGKVNWNNVKKSNIPIIGGSVPWSSEAKRLAQSYEVAIQGITRSETGAAMPAEEVNNTRERYQCNAWDSEDSCVQKFLSLKLFVNGYLDLTSKGKDGKGHYDSSKADAYDAKLQLNVQNYKKDWMQRAIKVNPQASPEQLQQLFNKKLLSDPKFLKKMGNQLRGK